MHGRLPKSGPFFQNHPRSLCIDIHRSAWEIISSGYQTGPARNEHPQSLSFLARKPHCGHSNRKTPLKSNFPAPQEGQSTPGRRGWVDSGWLSETGVDPGFRSTGVFIMDSDALPAKRLHCWEEDPRICSPETGIIKVREGSCMYRNRTTKSGRPAIILRFLKYFGNIPKYLT